MRVNVYAEEMTDRIEIIGKEIDGRRFTGLRFYLELPVTVGAQGRHRSEEGPQVYPPINGEPAQVSGPFIHRPGDDDSAAVTFWGKRDLREVLRKALDMLDAHYGTPVLAALPGGVAPGKVTGNMVARVWSWLDDRFPHAAVKVTEEDARACLSAALKL